MVIAITLATVAATIGCSPKGPTVPAPDLAPDATTYVALGDSFVSGPGIDPPDAANRICQRSENNWPTYLAAELDLTLTDVSCAGATTGHLVRSVKASDVLLKAQVDSLNNDTDLVTVGIGANDENLFGALVGECSETTKSGSNACRAFVRTRVPAITKLVERKVVKALAEIRKRAPHAAVVLVGYLTIAPETGACANLPMQGDDVQTFASGEQLIDEMLANAAEEALVNYVSLRTPGGDHNACGSIPWVNGSSPAPGDGVQLHPRRAGMQAVAMAVATALRPRRSVESEPG